MVPDFSYVSPNKPLPLPPFDRYRFKYLNMVYLTVGICCCCSSFALIISNKPPLQVDFAIAAAALTNALLTTSISDAVHLQLFVHSSPWELPRCGTGVSAAPMPTRATNNCSPSIALMIGKHLPIPTAACPRLTDSLNHRSIYMSPPPVLETPLMFYKISVPLSSTRILAVPRGLRRRGR